MVAEQRMRMMLLVEREVRCVVRVVLMMMRRGQVEEGLLVKIGAKAVMMKLTRFWRRKFTLRANVLDFAAVVAVAVVAAVIQYNPCSGGKRL